MDLKAASFLKVEIDLMVVLREVGLLPSRSILALNARLVSETGSLVNLALGSLLKILGNCTQEFSFISLGRDSRADFEVSLALYGVL